MPLFGAKSNTIPRKKQFLRLPLYRIDFPQNPLLCKNALQLAA